MKQSFTVEEIKRKMEHFCAYQERCHKDVEQKLKEFLLIQEAKDVILLHLINQNYLNETRFAKTFARGKFRIKKWGKRRIVSELKQRKISAYNIKQALLEINDLDYINTFNALALKKANTIKEKNVYKARKKLIDYLLYRGWETHLVYEKVNALICKN